MKFPVEFTIVGDDRLASAELTVTAADPDGTKHPLFGGSPVVFDQTGGTVSCSLECRNARDITIHYCGSCRFVYDNWPPIPFFGVGTVGQGANRGMIKPGSWIKRFQFITFRRDGDALLAGKIGADDLLTIDVSWRGVGIPVPIEASIPIHPPILAEFPYPVSSDGQAGQATLRATATIGGRDMETDVQTLLSSDHTIVLVTSKEGIEVITDVDQLAT